jgi:glucan endo-1,3-beta-D-glucosidase
VPSTENAKAYWDAVACPNLGVVNTWWFTLQDAAPVTPNPSFGIVGSTLSTTPLYDLSCSNVVSSSSAAQSSTATGTSSSVVGSSTGSSTIVGGGSGSSVTASSVASSILSGASSLSVAASSVLASSGGGLSPSQGGGVGGSSALSGYGANPSSTGPTASITQSVGSNGTSVVTGSIKPTGTASSSTTTPSQSIQPASAGTILSGSVVVVLGAFLAVIAAL